MNESIDLSMRPTHKEVNQREKRDRLPSANHLRDAQKRITRGGPKGISLSETKLLQIDSLPRQNQRRLGWTLRWLSTSRTSFKASKFNACACTTISKFRSGRKDGRNTLWPTVGFTGMMISAKMNLAEIIEELPKLTVEERQAIYRQIEELDGEPQFER